MTTQVKLKHNGLVIGNFSSPLSFTFDTGEFLDRCDKEWCKDYSAVKTSFKKLSQCGRYSDSIVSFTISDETLTALILAVEQVDIMLVSFSMLKALEKVNNDEGWYKLRDVASKCRAPFLNKDAKKTVSSSIFHTYQFIN
jgi:hypothetical protein